MSTGINRAGSLPAFTAYSKLGKGYALLWQQAHSSHRTHAYLIAGPRGVGKATFARFLAASLFCEKAQAPCGECDACHRVLSGNEPDVLEIASPDGKAISIERIREAIAAIAQHAFGNGLRIVIIEPAEKLTPAAQNCLLKSLEEPPGNVLFLLLTHEPSALLGTIASRCAMVKLAPWPDELLSGALLQLGYPQVDIDATLPLAAGNIGVALGYLQDEAGEAQVKTWIAQALGATLDRDVVTLSTRLKEDKDGADEALRTLEQALHQALLACTGIIPFQSVPEGITREWARRAHPDDLTALLAEIFETRKRRQSQVNWQASIDRLLTKIVEAKTRWQQL